MTNQVKALDDALASGHLVMVEFYDTPQTKNVWLESVIEAYDKQSGRHIALVSVCTADNEELVEKYRVSMAPAFILLLRGKELWRKLGKFTVDELQELLREF